MKDRMRNFGVSILCFGLPVISCFLVQGQAEIHGHFMALPVCAFKMLTGIPCPFCGMTMAFCEMSRFCFAETSHFCFAETSHFHFAKAFDIQPAGVVVYFLCLGAGLFFLVRGLLGKPFVDVRKGRYWTPAFNTLLWFVGAVWLCKIVFKFS